MIILLDMDGPLTDQPRHEYRVMRERFPNERPLEPRKYFELHRNFSPHLREAIEKMRREKGFYRSFRPVQEGIGVLKELVNVGHDVFICTSPVSDSPHCAGEKFEWVEEHIGSEYTRRIILTKDKTLVKGSFLIDDKPEITGVAVPEWKHLLYDATYNRRNGTPWRMDWDNWREVIDDAIEHYSK